MPLTTPLPTGFIQQIHELLPEEAPALLRALDEEPSVSIRLNARKTEGLLPGSASFLHRRSALACRLLLRTGSFFDAPQPGEAPLR